MLGQLPMNACHSVVIGAHTHLGFEGLASLIEQNPSYKVACYEDRPDNLVNTLTELDASLLMLCFKFAGDPASDTIITVKEALPEVAIVVVSAQPRPFDKVTSLYDAGANAFLCSTTANRYALFNALEQAINGSKYYTNSYQDQLVEESLGSTARKPANNDHRPTDETQTTRLGVRETQVLCLIAKGNSAKEVARILDISKNTVEVHRRNIMIKLGLRKSTELTRYAIENDLFDC